MSVGNLIAIMVKKKKNNENNQTELNYENKTLYTRLGKLLKTIVLLGVILVICVKKNQYYLLIGKKTWVIFPNWVSITFNQIHMIILLFVTDPNFKTEHEKGKK